MKTRWTAILLTVVIAAGLTYWGIEGIGVYGMALFIFTPIFIGLCPVILYGRKHALTSRQDAVIGFQALGIFTFCLMVFAIEGLICILMAAPFGLLFTWIGTLIGHRIIGKTPNTGASAAVILIFTIPATAFMEEKGIDELELIKVSTSIEINATPEQVWKNVVEFPILREPTEFIFKTGIAFPINAEIKGEGVGSIRYCNFSTGSFVEPITIWKKPTLLKFDVEESPAPMKELSFYDINAPHLHDYFISKQGQFKLIPLTNGTTQLIGTTWYYHNISPAFYWQLWSEYIVHKIHLRVLNHIKETTEQKIPA